MTETPVDERKARIRDVMNQLDRVQEIHAKMLRGRDQLKDTDGMMVRRLIRLLVEEWV